MVTSKGPSMGSQPVSQSDNYQKIYYQITEARLLERSEISCKPYGDINHCKTFPQSKLCSLI